MTERDGPAGGGASAPEAEVFGPYRLQELLGRGGMGEVWRAFDTRRERTVALKRLTGGWADVPAFQDRFRLEARTTARLDSEHVIVIHDYGEIDGRLYIDMRLVGGGDLSRLLAQAPRGLVPMHAADLCAQIGDGLDAAHRQHLVHRDVKPSNVLLASDGARQRAYLVDFGIAKLADELTATGLTATGATLGTPAYMAPELYEGAAAATPASDTYALGCVLFEMLTGRRVFEGTTAGSLMAQHLYHPPPPPSTVRPDLAPFDPVLARALAKDPAHRHPTSGALGEDAGHAAARVGVGYPPPVSGPLPVAGQPAGPPVSGWRRHRALLIAAAAVLVVLVVVAAVLIGIGASRQTAAPGPAGPPPRAVVTGPPQQLAVPLQGPTGVVFSPDGSRAYIADNGASAIAVVDTHGYGAVATVPVGAAPLRVTIAPDGRHVYVPDYGTDQAPGNTVTVIDTATNTVAATVPVGSEPFDAVVSPDGRRVYVTNTGSEQVPGTTVSVIDTATNTVTATVPVGPGPTRPAISPDGRQVYIPNFGSVANPAATITVIDTATNTPTTLPAGDFAPQIAIAAPDGRHVYILCTGLKGSPGSVQVLDTVSHTVAPLPAANPINKPYEAALTPDGRTLVIPENGYDDAPGTEVALVDTVAMTRRTVTIGGRPNGVAVAPDGGVAWVTVISPGQVWRVPLG